MDCVNARFFNITYASRQASQSMGVYRTCLKRFRHEPRMALIERMGSRPAFHQRCYIEVGHYTKASRALRAKQALVQQALVPREAHHIGAKFFLGQRKSTSGLSGIKDKQGTMLMGNLGHTSNIVHITGKVRCMGCGNITNATFRKHALVFVEVEAAIGFNRSSLYHTP
ncbi:unknown [Eggerthella sp. CAG:209]|nr:unknown [Eggerthella sp. CAG:209]